MREITDKHVLGPLCKNGHKFQNTNQSVRYKSTRQCVECNDAWRREHAPKYRPLIARCSREHYHRTRTTRLEVMSQYRQTEAFHKAQKKSQVKNKQKSLARVRDWRKTPRGKIVTSLNNVKRRKILETAIKVPFTIDELADQFQRFNYLCAYCGAAKNITVDHFIPLSCGGIEGLCNLVPACRPCNTSKRARNAYEWYKEQSFFSVSRWKKIRRVLRLA